MIRILFALLFFNTALLAQNRSKKLDSLFGGLHEQKHFNGNVLIAEKGQVIYEKSFGFSNEETKTLLNKNTSFELASVSKQFTAMGIVILKEKGRLSYDDRLSKYLPDLSGYENITIKQLLQHTSGIPDYMALMDSVWKDSTQIATNKDIILLLKKHQPKALFAAGSKWQYSNTGYVLLASIIEKLSGSDYGQFLAKNIFMPLQMNNSFVYNRRQKPRKIANSALGYVHQDSLKKEVLPDSVPGVSNYVYCMDGIVGDGMVNSTTQDLLKWDRALYTNKLVSTQSIKEIFTSGTLTNGENTDYGFGWRIENLPPFGKIAQHSGSWPGFITYIERHMDGDRTIILLQNHDHDGTKIPAKEVRNILYHIKPTPFVKLDSNSIVKFTGIYTNSKGKAQSIVLLNGLLYFKMNEQVKLELRPISATQFIVIGFDPEVRFEFIINNGKVEKYQTTQSGKVNEAIKTK